MNELEVRDRLRRAIGETESPPGMQASIEARLRQPTPREFPRGPWLLAVVLVVAMATALLTPVLVAHYAAWRPSRQPAVPAVVAPPSPTPSAVNATNCRLPVVILREAGPPPQGDEQAGFVDTRSGAFTADPAASVAGLPSGGGAGSSLKSQHPSVPVQYSPAFNRWLPVGGSMVAPDGRSYIWEKLLPEGSNASTFATSELHLYNLASAADRVLWTYAGSIDVKRWDANGILTTTSPPRGGSLSYWLVDPASGSVLQEPPGLDPGRPTILPGDSDATGSVGYGEFGQDAQGRHLFRIGSRAIGDREWIFFESAPGRRVTIYQGTQGDATAFDPFGGFGDTTGIWFGDYEQLVIWHWAEGGGLRKVGVQGLPALLSGGNSHEYVRPAGPCV